MDYSIIKCYMCKNQKHICYFVKYAKNYKLPIVFIVEDNNQSVMTNTKEVWGQNVGTFEQQKQENIIYYKYKNKYPHAGAGKRVQF